MSSSLYLFAIAQCCTCLQTTTAVLKIRFSSFANFLVIHGWRGNLKMFYSSRQSGTSSASFSGTQMPVNLSRGNHCLGFLLVYCLVLNIFHSFTVLLNIFAVCGNIDHKAWRTEDHRKGALICSQWRPSNYLALSAEQWVMFLIELDVQQIMDRCPKNSFHEIVYCGRTFVDFVCFPRNPFALCY